MVKHFHHIPPPAHDFAHPQRTSKPATATHAHDRDRGQDQDLNLNLNSDLDPNYDQAPGWFCLLIAAVLLFIAGFTITTLLFLL